MKNKNKDVYEFDKKQKKFTELKISGILYTVILADDSLFEIKQYLNNEDGGQNFIHVEFKDMGKFIEMLKSVSV